MIRQTLRSLRRNPGYTASAVLTIGLSAAAVGTGGGMLYRALLAPLLTDEPVVMIEPYRTATGDRLLMNKAEFGSWTDQEGLFEDSASRWQSRQGVDMPGGPRRLDTHYVSENFFRVLRIPFAVGAAFNENANGVVVSHEFWMNRLDGEEEAIGTILRIAERPYRITGVTARGVRLPGENAQIWVSATRENATRPPALEVFARLEAGTSMARARTEAEILFARLGWTRADEAPADAIRLKRLEERMNEPIAGVLRLIAMALVAALACGAFAFGTLLHLRGSGRSTDRWTRGALGEEWPHRIRRAAAEHGTLASAGATVALLLHEWAAPAAQNIVAAGSGGAGGPAGSAAGAVITAAAAATIALAGAGWAGLASRTDRQSRQNPANAHRSTRPSRPLRAATALQIGGVVVLIHAGATVYSSIQAMEDIEALGIADDRVLSMVVDLSPNLGLERAEQIADILELVEATSALPGVSSAAASLGTPGEPVIRGRADILHDDPVTGERVRIMLGFVPIAGEYFRTTGIPLIAGRGFDSRDADDAEWATILSESAARVLYADQDPIGRLVRGLGTRVVGVASDATYATEGEQLPVVYRPIRQFPVAGIDLLVNGAGDSLPDTRAVVEAIRRTNPYLPVEESRIMGAPPPAIAAERRARSWTIGAAASLIAMQAFVTLYGTSAYAAARRRREHALKITLGARRSTIAIDVLRTGALDTAAGLVIGAAAVAAADQHLGTIAAGGTGATPGTAVYAAVLTVVGALALTASLRPALRAAKVDPATILSEDSGT